MKTEMNFGTFSHAHCFRCNKTAEIGKFDYRKKVIASNDAGMELIQLVIICPVCKDKTMKTLIKFLASVNWIYQLATKICAKRIVYSETPRFLILPTLMILGVQE